MRIRPSVKRPVEFRFWQQVAIIPEHSCWEWLGAKSPKGYGTFGANRKHFQAHRFSWQIHFGPIPDGLLVCHKCDNPSCVRPEHLFLGTALDNTRDMINKGRNRLPEISHNGNKTHCPRGHAYLGDNIIYHKNGRWRWCRECMNIKNRSKPRFPRKPQTHCKRGHPYSGDNLVVDKRGTKGCRACRNLTGRINYLKYQKRVRKKRIALIDA